ncbi:MAG: hypothetical protein U1F29_13740 [Planctomycetota bacterium]
MLRSFLFFAAAGASAAQGSASAAPTPAPVASAERAAEAPQTPAAKEDPNSLLAALDAALAAHAARGGAHPAIEFLPRLATAARALAAGPELVRVLAARARLGALGEHANVSGAAAACDEALASLLAEHADRPELAAFCERLGSDANELYGLARSERFLAAVRAKSALADVREAAGLGLARARYDALDVLQGNGPRALRTLLEDLAAAKPATRRSRAAADLLRAWDTVRVQHPFPDAPAFDANGAPVEFGALKGRVVLVHVWSELDDAEREQRKVLSARLAAAGGKPLSIVGVYAPPAREDGPDALAPELDAVVERLGRVPPAERAELADGDRSALARVDAFDRARAAAALAASKPPFPVIVDGAPDGPWCRRHDVRRFPTTFVVDARGVLRYRDLPPNELELALASLLAEAAAPR